MCEVLDIEVAHLLLGDESRDESLGELVDRAVVKSLAADVSALHQATRFDGFLADGLRALSVELMGGFFDDPALNELPRRVRRCRDVEPFGRRKVGLVVAPSDGAQRLDIDANGLVVADGEQQDALAVGKAEVQVEPSEVGLAVGGVRHFGEVAEGVAELCESPEQEHTTEPCDGAVGVVVWPRMPARRQELLCPLCDGLHRWRGLF